MLYGLVIPCQNSVAHIDRVLYSLHNQSHHDWRAFVVDIGDGGMSRLLKAVGKARHCALMDNRVEHYRTVDLDGFAGTLDEIVASVPRCHVFGILAVGMRLDANVLEVVDHVFAATKPDVVQVQFKAAVPDAPIAYACFWRRGVGFGKPPRILTETELSPCPDYVFAEGTRVAEAAPSPMGLWFQ